METVRSLATPQERVVFGPNVQNNPNNPKPPQLHNPYAGQRK